MQIEEIASGLGWTGYHQSATQNIFLNKYGDKQQELKVSSHGQRTYVKKLANPSLCFVLVHAVLPSSPSSPSPPLHPFYRLSRLLFWAAEGGRASVRGGGKGV